MHRIFTTCIFLFGLAPIILLMAAENTGINRSSELRWMGHWKAEGLREQLVLEVLEDFRYLNQDINVKFAFSSDILPEKSHDQQARFIVDMIQSGTISWDVIWLDSGVYQSVAKLLDDPFWGEKYLVDFSNAGTIRDAHRPELLNSPGFCQSTGGILTGPYIEGFLYCLWYNTETAKRLGLTIPKEEMSFDNLLEYLQRVNEFNLTSNEQICAIVSFKKSGSFSRLAHNLLLSADPDTETRKAQLDVLKALEQIRVLHATVDDPENLSWPDAARMLTDDKALFLIESTWRYSSFEQFSSDLAHKMKPAQMPGFQKQNFYCGGFIPTWAVMKGSPAREAAVQLMEFWCKPEVIEKWTRYTKNPSGIIGSLYDPEYGNDPIAIYQRKLVKGRTLHPDFFMQPERSPSMQSILKFILPVITGETTAEDVMKELDNPAP